MISIHVLSSMLFLASIVYAVFVHLIGVWLFLALTRNGVRIYLARKLQDLLLATLFLSTILFNKTHVTDKYPRLHQQTCSMHKTMVTVFHTFSGQEKSHTSCRTQPLIC